jgi:hypothetical protein
MNQTCQNSAFQDFIDKGGFFFRLMVDFDIDPSDEIPRLAAFNLAEADVCTVIAGVSSRSVSSSSAGTTVKFVAFAMQQTMNRMVKFYFKKL